MRFLMVLAAVMAAPVQAQTSPSASADVANGQTLPVDAARLAIARQIVESVWPLGTYARMMDSQLRDMIESTSLSMLDMKAADAMAPYGAAISDDVEAATEGKTIRDLMAAVDPHFAERLDITNRMMLDEMTPILTRLEPSIRDGMAHAYARRFSNAQLEDLSRFFATPSGSAYASQSMLLFADPEVVSAMTRTIPELMKAMPEIMKKVQAATAHLPPPPMQADRE